MGLFHRKNDADKALRDRELISENAKSVDALAILAGQTDDSELKDEISKLKESLTYLIPSEEGKIYDYDKKIGDRIDDLRIAMIKTDADAVQKAKKLLVQLKLLITDRNSKI